MGNKASAAFKVLTYPREPQEVQQSEGRAIRSMWPFSAALPRELNEGDTILIEGKIADDAEIFSLNLVCEHDLSEKPRDVAYHHKLHFTEQKTIRNHKMGGQWREEEIIDDTQLEPDFVPGEDFEIEISIQRDGIYTYFNKSNQGIFEHKFPIDQIKYLQIWDGIEKVQSMKVIFA